MTRVSKLVAFLPFKIGKSMVEEYYKNLSLCTIFIKIDTALNFK
ncbi:hypothetical protein [Blochmannia endosymbiont of Camponotus sp.]|nr:hypothetical protein [Blochmannia endosymbiont of Camponotus sp.]